MELDHNICERLRDMPKYDDGKIDESVKDKLIKRGQYRDGIITGNCINLMFFGFRLHNEALKQEKAIQELNPQRVSLRPDEPMGTARLKHNQ